MKNDTISRQMAIAALDKDYVRRVRVRLKNLRSFIRRDPCKECMYYIPENNICQSKKCASNNPYVTFTDRLYCEPRKPEETE